MNIRFYFCLLVALLSVSRPAIAQSNFYATDTIQDVEITFAQPNWDYMMDTATVGSDGYLLATQVLINGVVFDSVGVRYKGNSSYDSTRAKNPLHIKLDYVHGSANYNGYSDVKLSNGFSDPSSIREVLAYDILRNYMAAPQCNFARVKINGTYYGVYSSAETIDDNFVATHFYSSSNTFVKCNPVTVLNGHIPNLVYLGQDSANYYDRYELKSNLAWKNLIHLCDTIANASAHIDTLLDTDRALWMLAFNDETVNLDSYSGAYAQNYYLYQDDNRRFNPIVWDLNMCFGSFTNTGSSNLTITGMQQMTPLLHASNAARPLIMNLLSNATYQRMYIAHMRTMNNEFFVNGNYATLAQNMQTLIDSSVQAENFSLYTYPQFQQGMTANVSTIPGISNLMSARATYLSSTTQFQYTPPTISAVTTAPGTVSLNDTIWVTANVTTTNTVMLGSRDQSYHRFRRVPMYDDGLHHDGAAGDNVYGAYMIAGSALMQYYIYAENADAGMFAPERAEYEFYSVQVAVSTASPGQVVINEFMASNQNDATNETGQHEDWIELYNRMSTPLNLLGLYLTDDYTNPTKFALPDVTIPAYGYRIIWADQGSTTSQYVHCNFKLSAAGEELMLSNSSGAVLDSITFGAQITDASMGRCPNGTGPFILFSPGTFGTLNVCPAGVAELPAAAAETKAYPNPASGMATIITNDARAQRVELFGLHGERLLSARFENDKAELSLEELAAGIYFYTTSDSNGAVLHSEKLVIIH